LYLFFYIYFIDHSLISTKQHPVWDNVRWPYIQFWPSNHIIDSSIYWPIGQQLLVRTRF